jgi:hypothetical protein
VQCSRDALRELDSDNESRFLLVKHLRSGRTGFVSTLFLSPHTNVRVVNDDDDDDDDNNVSDSGKGKATGAAPAPVSSKSLAARLKSVKRSSSGHHEQRARESSGSSSSGRRRAKSRDRASRSRKQSDDAVPVLHDSTEAYVFNDHTLAGIELSDGTTTHVFDDEDDRPVVPPAAAQHLPAASTALEQVAFYQPAFSREAAAAVLCSAGEFLLRDVCAADRLGAVAPHHEAFVLSVCVGASVVQHVAVEFDSVRGLWRAHAPDLLRLGFPEAKDAASVDGLVLQLPALTRPFLVRQRRDLRVRSGASNTAFAAAEARLTASGESPRSSHAPLSPRVNVEVIDDVQSTVGGTLMALMPLLPMPFRTEYGRLVPDSDVPVLPFVADSAITVVHQPDEVEFLPKPAPPEREDDAGDDGGDDADDSSGTDYTVLSGVTSALFGTFVERNFQELQVRDAAEANAERRERAMVAMAPQRHSVRRVIDDVDDVAESLPAGAAFPAPKVAAPTPLSAPRVPAPMPPLDVERDVLRAWKSFNPKPANLPLLRPDVFLVARGPLTLIRPGREPLPLRVLLFNTYLLMCKASVVSKSHHELNVVVIVRVSPAIAVTHGAGTKLVTVIHPNRLFMLEARSERAAATWSAALTTTCEMSESSRGDADVMASSLGERKLPSAPARERLRQQSKQALAAQVTAANQRLLSSYTAAHKSRLRRLKFPIMSMSSSHLTFELERTASTLSVTFSNDGTKRLYLAFQCVTEVSDFRFTLSPASGKLVVEAGKSAQLFVSLLLKRNDPPPLLAYLPIEMVGGAAQRHAHIGVLWICCSGNSAARSTSDRRRSSSNKA